MPVVQAGLPVAWNDALCPAHAAGSGVAAPSYTTDFIAEVGSEDNDPQLRDFEDDGK